MNFDVAAAAYDRYMGRWSERLSPQLADFAGLRAGDRVLDVGCGPGNLARELASRLGASAVTAVDPSQQFVAAARSRVPGVDIRQATAEDLPFPDSAFDVTLAQLVVHFMRDPVLGLAEMARVTRHGGVVAACVWNYAENRGPLGPFWEAAQQIDADVVDESGLAGTRNGHLAELFTAAGLQDVEQTVLSARREYQTFEEWWEPFTLGVGPGGGYVAHLAPDTATALRERCRELLPPAPFLLTAEAWAARGRAQRLASTEARL